MNHKNAQTNVALTSYFHIVYNSQKQKKLIEDQGTKADGDIEAKVEIFCSQTVFEVKDSL